MLVLLQSITLYATYAKPNQIIDMKYFVKLNQTFFCLSLGMSGSLWAKRASIFSISDVVNVDVDDDDDDDDDDDGDDVDDDDDDDQQLREQAHSVTTGNDHDRNTVTITQWSRSTLYCL